jgi:hypothetical protein
MSTVRTDGCEAHPHGAEIHCPWCFPEPLSLIEKIRRDVPQALKDPQVVGALLTTLYPYEGSCPRCGLPNAGGCPGCGEC